MPAPSTPPGATPTTLLSPPQVVINYASSAGAAEEVAAEVVAAGGQVRSRSARGRAAGPATGTHTHRDSLIRVPPLLPFLPQAMTIKCNVGKPAEVDAMFKAAVEKFGKIDVLVNNAGEERGGEGAAACRAVLC
jgi:3-oxoacyl-[acyl-carrier protein] reductase